MGAERLQEHGKYFKSADGELDKRQNGTTFHPKCLASHRVKGASVAEIQEYLDSVKSQLCNQRSSQLTKL